ncbi:MAG: hypothetical protein H6742_15915 [Alphaproteobacteria bacterium]|nr:hypothetical protein [Alphaproteobacteria bacterium]
MRRFPAALGYLLLALLVTGRTWLAPLTRAVGYPNIDAWDTMMLRGVLADLLADPTTAPVSDSVFFPIGYPVLQLTPNVLDHLTGAPLSWLLPFPLSDNLWWLLVLALNGWAAHRLGRKLGDSEAAGWLCGVAFLLSEPVVREANLHHAPQTMLFWAPLFVHELLCLREAPTLRRAVGAGALLAGAGLSYWYLAVFLVLGCLPLLWGLPLATLGALGGTTALITAPFLAPYLLSWGDIPLTAGADAPPPQGLPDSYAALPHKQPFVALHGSDLLFWLRRVPLDTSNRLGLALLAAAALGFRKAPTRQRVAALWLVGLGAVMVLGPYLRWGDEVVLIGGQPVPLPFRALALAHPFLERLTWPERWGVVMPLGLLLLAARAPRPALLALVVGAEAVAVSANLPLQSIDLRHRVCHAELAPLLTDRLPGGVEPGAVIELPLKRPGLQAPRAGVHRRLHRRPVVDAILLPPGAEPLAAWKDWMATTPAMAWIRAFEDGAWPDDPGAAAIEELRAAGIAAIVLDAEPGVVQTRGGLRRHRAGLQRTLGEPIDLGCALVWWLSTDEPPPVGIDDGDAWREAAQEWKQAHPTPALDTLISPASDRGGW